MKSPVPTFLPALLPFTLLIAGLLYSIRANGQQANFTYTASPASLCAPTTISLQNTSSGFALAYNWDLGDGTTSHIANPQVSYTQPGTYRITLSVDYANGTSQVWKEVTVNASPTGADFSVNTANSCKPFTAIFTDHTLNATSRTWDFGDGTPSQTTSSGAVSHAYTRTGNFTVTLVASNAFGCSQTVVKPSLVNIAVPIIDISGTNLNGCAPVTASLMANVTTNNNDPAAQYVWAFGDGTTQTTTTGNVNHTYNGLGNFSVTVTATTQQGCAASLTTGQMVRTGTRPSNVSFTATPGTACAGDPIRLLANASNADTYSWDFGDGTTQEGPQNDITHGFRSNGSIMVQMKAGQNGCFTGSAPVTVQITGPAAHFTYSRSCANRNTFSFTNTTSAANPVTYEWDFGDGSPLEYTRDATHTYSRTGNYTVRMTVRETTGTCTSSDFQTVAYFRPDFSTGISTICRGSNISYGVLNVPQQLADHYSWRFGDNSQQNSTSPDITKAYQQSGTFTDTLIIFYKDPAVYCNDTVVKVNYLTIMAPVASFTIGQACVEQPVIFTDKSQTWPNIPLTNWTWNLGGGVVISTQNPPPTKYRGPGTFPVTLVITDARNCRDSITQHITVHPTPFVTIAAPSYKICEGNSITLNTQTDGNVIWSPNTQLSCVNCVSPVASPVTNTQYVATASNAFGCSVTDTVNVTVVPVVQLATRPDTTLCVGGSVQLTASGAASYTWTPATYLTAANINNPVSTPVQDITYTVTGVNDASCPSANQQVTLHVKPLPTVNAGPDQTVTAGTRVQLEASGSPDITQWEWMPGNGIDCPHCPFTQADVRQPGSYTIKVTNVDGCTNSDLVDIHLVCDRNEVYIPNAFSPNGDGQNDIFYPRGKGVNFIKSFRIFNRWGLEVFKRENINIEDISAGWNGAYKNQPQPAEVYIYVIEARCDSNEMFELKGNVTLLR
ncbi:PKD domain-containing protein [Chitinophaga agrisoli]|uniref:PKD domain-containing protein n=1 Tax=Chitinophaga agrisoli TaxID=2607653 RepID=A0A5B2VQQ8_9BACT|nr:PKD domain-containing protein [Chitinophaga agrisoli]KAA2240479.1 PKD domain-containing protein [Chitinophaga agrisoli]